MAGGRGKRLRPITDTIPKPMAPVNGIPFLDYLIYSLSRAGFKKILILVGYKSEVIISRYKNQNYYGIDISFSYCHENCQTGKRISDAYNQLDKYFLLVYGDNYWPIELKSMIKLYNSKSAEVITTVFSNKNGTSEYGKENNIEVLPSNLVKRYDKKRNSINLNGVDIGYFIVNKNIVELGLGDDISFERDILPGIIKRNGLYAFITDTQYYFITNIKSLKQFEQYVIQNNVISLKNHRYNERNL